MLLNCTFWDLSGIRPVYAEDEVLLIFYRGRMSGPCNVPLFCLVISLFNYTGLTINYWKCTP